MEKTVTKERIMPRNMKRLIFYICVTALPVLQFLIFYIYIRNMIKLNNNQLKIIELIRENPNITRNELANKLDITPDGIKYNLRKLVNNSIIERIGPNNGGYWKIK